MGNAVLVSRMSKAWRGELQAAQVKPGDWNCPGCGDHNFARNKVCRSCSAGPENAVADADVEAFLQSNAIEDHAAGVFRELPGTLQKVVMDAGSLADARNPTAVLVSRIGRAKQGTLKMEEMRPGDWKCPVCGDHNFARNESCRKCSAAAVHGAEPSGDGWSELAG